MKHGGIGVIEEGLLKGKSFIIPSEVWVERGTHASGLPIYAKACLIHQRYIVDQGCPECAKEERENKELQKQIQPIMMR